ncbi:hypothetical protein D9M72_517180 [compost metagenome]
MSSPDEFTDTRSPGPLIAAAARSADGGMCRTSGSHTLAGCTGISVLPPGLLVVPAGSVPYPKKSTTPHMV